MTTAIILAAGNSTRFKNKLFASLRGKPVLWHAVNVFEQHHGIDEIYIAVNGNNKKLVERIAKNFKKVKSLTVGGKTRQASVANSLAVIFGTRQNKVAHLVVHNGANPMATNGEITRCLSALRKNASLSGVGVGRKVADTIREVRGSKTKTINRSLLWQMETPQIVRAKPFLLAHRAAKRSGFVATDDLALLEKFGGKVKVIPASAENFKITTELDLIKMRAVAGDMSEKVRIGYGEDSHMFDEKGHLRLGGLTVRGLPKLAADSDGDVVLHALATAVSQAAGGGSLGMFADRMSKRGIKNSKLYLKHVLKKYKFGVLNVGINIECARPKIDPIVPEMKRSIAALLGLRASQIGITAHTGERLTAFGRGKGVRCTAAITCVNP